MWSWQHPSKRWFTTTDPIFANQMHKANPRRKRPDASDTAKPRSKSGSVRVSHRVVREVQDLLDRGTLKPGSYLPSERELAADFLVSRGSVREALSILETLGIVSIEPGRRARLVDQSGAVDKMLTRWQHASRFNEADVFELRLVLEPRAARLAAEKLKPSNLADLTASLATMKDSVREGDLLSAANEDFNFHNIIVALSGNQLFKEIHNLNRDVILDSQRLPLPKHKRLWEPSQEHARILGALEQRDPDGAAYLMQMHIIKAAERIGITLKP